MSQNGANTNHSDADEAAEVIEERLRLIIDTIPTIIWRKSPDGSADFLNRNFREYTGLSLEDGLGRGWLNVFHPDDRLKEKWPSAMAAGKPFQTEARLRGTDGQYRWFLIRAMPLRDERGNIVKWYGLTCEIEDLKRAEDRIRLIIDALPTMVWTMEPNGAVDFVNQRWMDYMGLSLKEEMDEPTRPVHPEDLPRVLEKWRADMAAGEASEDEMRLRRADGEYRWFLVRTAPLRDEQGNILKWYGVSIDIEDRKRAEEAVKSSEREQRHIAAQLERERTRLVEAQEMGKIGSWEAELQSMNVIWSDQTHRIFETDPSRFHATRPKFREFIHPEDRAKVDAAFVASLDKRSPSTVEYRIVMPDGRVKIVEERWQAFHDEEGKPVRVAGTCRDITERVRAEEELQRLSGQLLRLQDEERRRIATDLHDSTGQDLVALATTLSQLHAAVPSSSRKLRKLASQCQAGVEDAIRHYAGGFTERTGIEIELEISPRLGRMKADAEMALFRVVQESLTNIQRHSGNLQAKIRMDREPGKITVEVSDSGSGITGDLQRQNGEFPFRPGVGIRSMNERVKLIGGRLDIESSSSGTTVRVTIPADD